MRVYFECYPCFFHQAINVAGMIPVDDKLLKDILAEVSRIIPTISEEMTPPQIGREVYRIVSRLTGIEDPFREAKKQCTEQALSLYPALKEKVASSSDRLMTAVRVAIAGNVIDFGSNVAFDLDRDVQSILTQEFAINHYDEFQAGLAEAESILYIADNAGECVFDRILIEEIGKPVTYVVRESPIINDAVMEDALSAGIGDVAEIISSGADAPGNILPLCSEEFLEVYANADFIISKGQGNYEGLSEEARPIFFLLKAKCAVIAKHIGVAQGSIILMQARSERTGWIEA
jgi:uncharacterized protein with ATP-grasp and redox domains